MSDLFDRAKIINIFTSFLPPPVLGDGLLAAHCHGLPCTDTGYPMKVKNQEGIELQTKE